ncbi:hypothetical protein [Paenibacillus lutrae]|uniref:Uncharacterized protein n=1 Tax=Paenibacillus lutrae TaxID=2078573 RepID=A0A7X3FHE9_9BACL|nr:hypothetical protein [Paenibacillus lutrae]MVO99809.1 hypothetical protein [Paenibacillus lutrae]
MKKLLSYLFIGLLTLNIGCTSKESSQTQTVDTQEIAQGTTPSPSAPPLTSPVPVFKEVAITQADYRIYNNADELEKNSDYIVMAKFEGKRSSVDRKSDGGQFLLSDTLTEMKVNRILKGDKDISNFIIIYEPAFIKDGSLRSTEGYNLVKEGSEYILYLRKVAQGDKKEFMVVGMYQGKYDISRLEPVDTKTSYKNAQSELWASRGSILTL